jgi:hypothetical protein
MRAELNWRDAYTKQIALELDQLRAWRRSADLCPPTERRQCLPGLQRSRSLFDLTEQQLEDIARYRAELGANEAIHKHNQEQQL